MVKYNLYMTLMKIPETLFQWGMGQLFKEGMGQLFKGGMGQLFKGGMGQLFKEGMGQLFKEGIEQLFKGRMGHMGCFIQDEVLSLLLLFVVVFLGREGNTLCTFSLCPNFMNSFS